MLTTRNILLNVKRNFVDLSGKLSVESVCNEENRGKCLDKMRTVSKRMTTKLHPSTKVASVLIPIVNCDDPASEPSILYTLRSNKLRKHISQVSFPGGILDETDASYIDCALRETEEEIGIERDQVILWGHSNLVNLQNAPAIMPVIGMIKDYNSDLLKVNSDEVERVFTVSLSELCRQKHHTQFRMIPRRTNNSGNSKTMLTGSYSIPVFTVDDARIWGITAIITHLFLSSLLPEQLYDKDIPYISKYKSIKDF